jgi:hypothetical protein
MSPCEILDESVVSWLLEKENPSVRFWALQQIEDRNLSDKLVQATQDDIMASDCVHGFFSAMKNNNHWEKPDDMYNPKYRATTHNLLILAEMGVRRTEIIENAIEHLFQFQRNSGHFLIELPKTEKGRASQVKDGCCIDGNILYYLNHFGFLEDPRTQKLIDFQVEYYDWEVTGWKCRAFPIDPSKAFPANCYMGRVKNLRGLATIPKAKRSKEVQKIIDKEIQVIMENGIYKYLKTPEGERKEKAGWKRFGFPLFYQSDILEVMDTLTGLGVCEDWMQESIDIILSARQDDGKWLLKHTFNGKMICDFDEKHKPSKWITLRALRVLRRFYS